MNTCSMCNQNIKEMNNIFNSIKDDVPKDRHYIFDDYAKVKRKICLECYIKTVIMFQKAMAGAA